MKLNINDQFSDATKKLIVDCRLTAIRYNNDFIALQHFYLIYNRYRKNECDLRVSVYEKKAMLNGIIGVNGGGKVEDSIPLTKDFERAFKFSSFHRWIVGDKWIEPRNIHLAILAEDIENKQSYFEYLDYNKITLSNFKKFVINSFFSRFVKQTGLRRYYK